MAENKKSFILYSDLLSVVEKLVVKDRENKTNFGGELFLHILKYVNDKEPVAIDFIIDMAFEPIRLQLKRDLESYEAIKEKRSSAGKKSAEIKKQSSTKSTSVESVEKCSTNSTVNDTVNVNENVNDILLEKETKQINLSDQVSEDHFSDDKIPNAEKEKSSAKKEKPQPPDLETFLLYAREVYLGELKIDYQPYDFTVRAKYQSWIEAGWKDGNKNPIQNWKSKLKNTIPHLKPIYGKFNSNSTNTGFSNQKGNSNGSSKVSGKVAASSILARQAREQFTRNGEGGDTTIEAEVVG